MLWAHPYPPAVALLLSIFESRAPPERVVRSLPLPAERSTRGAQRQINWRDIATEIKAVTFSSGSRQPTSSVVVMASLSGTSRCESLVKAVGGLELLRTGGTGKKGTGR